MGKGGREGKHPTKLPSPLFEIIELASKRTKQREEKNAEMSTTINPKRMCFLRASWVRDQSNITEKKIFYITPRVGRGSTPSSTFIK